MYRKLKFDKRLRRGLDEVDRFYKIGEGGKYEPANPRGARTLPWIFTHSETRKKFCGIWNGRYTLNFSHIPTYCRFSCWKVVIKPRNVKETFECHDIMREIDHPGKIGMDLRKYTYGAWAGFFYCESLEQGRKIWKIARDKIPADIPVILKRGCTEMERLRPSNLWDAYTPKEIEFEEYLNDIFSFQEGARIQADWLKAEIKERWIERAIEIGDPTAREMAEKMAENPETIWDELVVNSLTYHDSDPRQPEEANHDTDAQNAADDK